MEPELPEEEQEQRQRELVEIKEEQQKLVVREALGKLNFFLHVTAWFAGCAYLLLLGVFVSKAMPYVFIPIGLWTIGLAWHGWRAWHFGTHRERAASKALKKMARDAAGASRGNSPSPGDEPLESHGGSEAAEGAGDTSDSSEEGGSA